jgi:hypothetical protein
MKLKYASHWAKCAPAIWLMSAHASAKQEYHYDEAGNVVPLEELPPVCDTSNVSVCMLVALGVLCRGPLSLQPAPPAPAEPYYWEDGGDEEAAALKRMKHTAHWAATGVLSGLLCFSCESLLLCFLKELRCCFNSPSFDTLT